VLGRLSVLEAKDWPDLETQRISWMRDQVERLFLESAPARTTVWHNENQLTYQNVLPLLVRLTDRYLGGLFPLQSYARVQLPNLTKNQNPRIAEAMTLLDLANTDLHDFLQTVEVRTRL
jgi:uncharacterized protein (DUF2132 family)